MERISTSYLEFLTDDFSIWQHSKGHEINYQKGYALDDGARALIFALTFGKSSLARIYYNFIKKSVSENFINFYSNEQKPIETVRSDDAIGQTYWAMALWQKSHPEFKTDLTKIETTIQGFQSPRGLAYSLIGASVLGSKIANNIYFHLNQLFQTYATLEWPWIETRLTYGNAIIPLSFLEYYKVFGKQDALIIGQLMLNFLNKEMKMKKTPIAIGNKGWYTQNFVKALYDQQPIDIAYQVITNVRAYEITGKQKYLREAMLFFTWFWGNNLAGKPLIDITNQRCLDGLREKSISKNSGAESIICFLWAQEKLWPHLESFKTIVPVNQNTILRNFFDDVLKGHVS